VGSLTTTPTTIPQNTSMVQNKRVLELGAGIGLPSALCRDVLKAKAVVATDFWKENNKLHPEDATLFSNEDKSRLIPEAWHGMNLRYNIQRDNQNAFVQRVDWHHLDTVKNVKKSFGPPDLVIGSDLIYYRSDLPHFCATLLELLSGSSSSGGCKDILLVSPLPPDEREALPDFRDWLKEQAANGRFQVETRELTLYRNVVKGIGEKFLQMSIRAGNIE
jgi:hypothetical protein